MPASLDGRLVVAISSHALFDFEGENRVFEASDDRAYMQLQLQRLDEPAEPGVVTRWSTNFSPSTAAARRRWKW